MTDSHILATIDLQHQVSNLTEWKKGVESAIDALTEATVKLREDMTKTNQAGLLENRAWFMTDRMVTQMNDLLGMQQTQIRDLVRQCAALGQELHSHLEEMGYSE